VHVGLPPIAAATAFGGIHMAPFVPASVTPAAIAAGAPPPPFRSDAGGYCTDAAHGAIAPQACAAYLGLPGAVNEMQHVIGSSDEQMPATLHTASGELGRYVNQKGKLTAQPHADPLPIALIETIKQSYRRGGHKVLQPFASEQWRLQAIIVYSDEMLNPGGVDTRGRETGWSAAVRRWCSGSIDHLRLERDTAPLHAIIGYMLRIFGEPVVLAFKTCVAVIDEARRRVLPMPALRRLVEQIYRPFIENLELSISMWATIGEWPSFDKVLSTHNIALAYEHLCFNVSMVQLAPPVAAGHGSARSGGQQHRPARGGGGQRNGAVSKRPARSSGGGHGSGGSGSGAQNSSAPYNGGHGGGGGGGRPRTNPDGGRGKGGSSERSSNPRPQQTGGERAPQDPRLRAFCMEQGKHLPPNAPDNKKACAFYVVWGWCPLGQCSHAHAVPAWFDRDAFLAKHRS
jgi:hypothetical protein